MDRVIVRSQSDLDVLPERFEQYTVIEIRVPERTRISITKAWENSSIVAMGNSNVVTWKNSSVEAWENSSIVAMGNSNVVAWDNSSVEARNNSRIEARDNSSVVARDTSRVEARDNSSVAATDNSNVVAWDNSSVVAWDNSRVEAWDNSRVEAWDNSRVEAGDNSRVVARENSSVEAWENSRVEAWGAGVCRVFSSAARVELHGHAVALLQSDGASALRKSSTATILQVTPPEWTVEGWIEREGVTECDGRVVLYKRVSQDWKTQEGQPWETCWQPGTLLTHPAWQPDDDECGAGKFHACSRPYFCDEFRQEENDRYVAIAVRREDMYAWRQPWYPHKIAVRAAEVLYECDRFGRRTS